LTFGLGKPPSGHDMAIVFQRRNRPLIYTRIVDANDESGIDTTESFDNGGDTFRFGFTDQGGTSEDCGTGLQETNSGSTTVSIQFSFTDGAGGTFGTILRTNQRRGEATTDLLAGTQTRHTYSTFNQRSTGRTTFTGPNPPDETQGEFDTEEDDESSDTFDNVTLTETIASQSIVNIEVNTTLSTETTLTRRIGTTDENGDATTTTGSTLESTIRILTTTTIPYVSQTTGTEPGGEDTPSFCNVAFDTIYEAGECEQLEVIKGIGGMIAASDLAVDKYTHEAEIDAVETISEDGRTYTVSAGTTNETLTTITRTVSETFESIKTQTYGVRMVTTLGGIFGEGTILANVIQNAEKSGPLNPVGNTFTISVAATVTDTAERAIRAQGTSYTRQLGNVVLVNTINPNDTLSIQGVPSESTQMATGGGFPDIGVPRFTFAAGIYNATKVNGSGFETMKITQSFLNEENGAPGDNWAFQPVLAFAPITGTFLDDFAIHVRDCCATTNL
jgi:hypothetical protein